MTTEPLYQLPKEIPPHAQRIEDRLRQIRERATVSDRLEAYRKLLEVAQ